MPKNRVTSDIRAIQRSLHTLDRTLRRFAVSMGNLPKDGAAPPRRKLTLSPGRRAALKLQGRYMGYLRQLTARQKAEVRALKVKKGMRPAIARARHLARA